MKGPAIHVEHLSLRLGASQVLHELNFSVDAGALHCIVGPNGGGKTSAVRCILGQMPHDGSIQLAWPDNTRTIGYVPQLIEMERTLPLSIDDFMRTLCQRKPAFMATRKAAQPQIHAALERVGLCSKRKLMLGSLSGGERQRLLFAQALIPAPALLVLDEPMTNLDESGSRLFEQLIGELHADGTTVLWINHDLEQVRRLAQSITVIDRSLLAHGPVDTTLTDDMARGVFTTTGEAA